MKRTKGLEKIINKLVKSATQRGMLDEAKIKGHIKSLKTLPTPEAIMALQVYLKRVKVEREKTTLTIESAVPLSGTEVRSLTNALKAQHYITSVETKINPLIFGGLRIKIGDITYDNSIAERILQVTEEIRG